MKFSTFRHPAGCLKILLLEAGQIPIVNWDVITCKRQVIGDDIFTVPKGFSKKVSSEMELFMKEEESGRHTICCNESMTKSPGAIPGF